MKHLVGWAAALVLFLSFFTACASSRPSLYPNAQLQRVGMDTAEMEIDACMELAKTYGTKNNPVETAAGETATNATVGAVSGAAVGAIYDNAGQGALAGAVSSGVSGLVRRILHPRAPDPVYRQFMERCLREKGYEPMSW